MSFRPSQFCSCGVPSVHGLSGPAGLPLLRVSSSQFSVVECGVFVGCQCSHICVLPCTLCPLFWCCLYILYVIASLCICNCLCLCTFFFVLAPYTNLHVFLYTHLHVVVCTYCMKIFLCLPLSEYLFLCLRPPFMCLCVPHHKWWPYVYSGAQSIYAPLTTVVFLSLGYKYRSRRLQNIVSTVACYHANTRPLSVSAMP